MIPHAPNFDEFQRLAQGARMVPVYRQLVSDTLTPVLAYCKLQWGPGSFLFESVIGGEKIGRYSFLGADPFLQIQAYGTRVTLTQGESSESYDCDDPLNELEKLLKQYPGVHVPGLPRFTGGAVGYAGYDSVRYTEHLPNAPEDDRNLPDLSFAFYDRMVVFDHVNKTVLVIVTARTDGDDLQTEYDRACERVDEICQQLQRGTTDLQLTDIDPKAETPSKPLKSNRPEGGYQQTVEGIKEYIKAGDVFQVVPSERWELQTQARPIDIYRSLRVVNPSPFMFLLRTAECTLIGSSPEIMVRVEDGETTIRPLAGTRRRGATEAEDRALAEELLADPKERAEHVMLIDLARNDVGRIAEYGSVKLSDVMVVERYSHVMHITSNVTGQLKPGLTALDALRAGLPAGTVSGAPKVRAMEIIDEFETTRRGPYGGAVGYLDFTGDMDTCIALRTMVMQGQTVYLQAGGGIVADSDPEAEYQEIRNKARGLLKAIEVAEAQL
ncbi:anthranilate synthase component I [Thalassoroseus pseudoceratinae]|uniref:anthranilate synthase component I n=1 Tax=Thalassoroseus pseudoceratinae TaxID=2713176 RepID=UPI00142321AA|nr:anthranilate synthase component I [Thalassoroseus pseudoceratinae]